MMTAAGAAGLGGQAAHRAGTFVAERLRVLHGRPSARLRQDFERAFEKVDVLLTPVTPTTAFPLGRGCAADEMRSRHCTVAVNLAGCRRVHALRREADGLPIGLQLSAAFGGAQVLQAAYTYERLAWRKAPAGLGGRARRLTSMATETMVKPVTEYEVVIGLEIHAGC